MKILSAQQIRQADQYTIKNEPISSLDLMERAASKCTEWILKNIDFDTVTIYCGVGNNGGDGLVIGRQLYNEGKDVSIRILEFSKKYSEDFKANLDRLDKEGIQYEILPIDEVIVDDDAEVVIDAVFGSGLDRPVIGDLAERFEEINYFDSFKLAIDIPSGMFADRTSVDSMTIDANYTLTFQLPKVAFLMPENDQTIGGWEMLDIGLDEDFISSIDTDYIYVNEESFEDIDLSRPKFSHKGTYGHVKVVAGSKGKIGAAVLCSKAAIRSGAGLVTTEVPECGIQIIQSAVPEVMVDVNIGKKLLQGKSEYDSEYVYAIGPGIGIDLKTELFLEDLLEKVESPVVLDADAINILSGNKEWLKLIPEFSILTPHPKELERLIGEWENDFERLEFTKQFCNEHQLIIVIKGAHSSIVCPDGRVYFNSTGNPGMATAGSGDVLTGIIASKLAQLNDPILASILGVYQHGKSGDLLLENQNMEIITAGDLIEGLKKV